jgi:hypothetical protein
MAEKVQWYMICNCEHLPRLLSTTKEVINIYITKEQTNMNLGNTVTRSICENYRQTNLQYRFVTAKEIDLSVSHKD